MACEYFVNGKSYSEIEFKQLLNNGLLDSLIKTNNLELSDFPIDEARVSKKKSILKSVQSIPVGELQKLLIEEIKSSRNSYPEGMISALELDEKGTNFKLPLWSSPYAIKFESLLTSLVSKRIIKQKFKGGSYVLGSQEGFKYVEGLSIEESLYKFSNEVKKSDIVFTENFNEKDGLQPMRYDPKTKKMLPAQILLPFKFRDAEGNLLKAKDFTREVNGRIVIDTSAIPQELLMLFGFRIPTQGLNSMTMVEIVGFLPEVMGDLVIAPRDFTVQMGSDFDVDKLYSYKKDSFFKDGKFHTNFLSDEIKIKELLAAVKTKVDGLAKEHIKNKEDLQMFKDYVAALEINKEEGEQESVALKNIIDALHLEKNETKKEFTEALSDIKLLTRSYEAHLKNKIFDIHMATMSNAHPEVVKAIVKPDGFGKFVGLAEELDALKQEELLSPLSETYQRNQYVNASSGKLGVGVFSLDSTFNALLQGKDIVYMNVSAEDMEGLPKTTEAIRKANKPVATFGDNVSDGYMSNKYTIASQKIIDAAKGRELSKEEKQKLVLKSDIIQALQSLAVDNAKEQLMPKLNISNNTFDAIRALAILGFEEVDIIGLINQPIVTEYLERLEKEQSSIVEFRPNVAEELLLELQVKYDPDNTLLKTENKESLENISGEELMNIIKEGKKPQALTSKEFVSDINKQQLLLLNKFIKLSEIGKTFKTIQSTINTQSKGIPKNLIETSLKVDQVSKIESTGVFNAEKLLGEFSAGQLVKPTTLNGFATYYGLMEADKMYRKFFPYSADGFKSVTQEAINYINKEEKGITAQAELQKDIMENLRSYLFSNEETALFNDNIENERRRLFLDINGNKSLATILKSISTQEWFKKNKFLSQLTPSANKNGQLSRIFNEAAVGDNFDESDIYVSFLNLFTNNTLEIGTYNGIKYTPFKLAEDLITYAYLEGGKQGAKQFIKYIPPVYLKNTKLGSYLNSLYFSFNELGGIPNYNGSVNYYNPSTFIRQYFQNNPSKVPSISVLEMENVKEKDIKTLSSFSLSTLGKAKHKKVIRQEGQLLTTYNKFVVAYDNTLSEEYALFEYNDTTKVYERIPVVSDKNDFSNYNPTMSYAQPIQSNRYSTTKVIPLQEGYTNSEQDLSDLVGFDDTVIKNTKPLNIIADFEISDSLSNVDQVKDLLTQISKNKDVSDTFRLLANKYSKMDFSIANSSKKPFKLVVINDDQGIRGGFNTDTNTLTLNKAIDTTSEKLIETLIHETSHIFTSALIKADPKTLTEEQRVIIQSLNNLQSRYKEHLKATRSVKELYAFRNAYIALTVKDVKEANRLIEKPIEGLEDIPMDSILEISNEITQKAVSKFYGAIKLEEFVTMALTDKGFQEHLNSIKDKTTSKTFFESIIDLLVDVLNSLGLAVTPNSVLATVIKDSLQLIESSQTTVKQTAPQVVENSLFKVKIDQFNYTYNPTTNEVIHNAKSGDKVETNDTQINKVLVQYALANNKEQRTFNGSTYVAIADRVLNIKNANEVGPETWEQAVSINTPVKETSTNANTKYELFPGVFANQGQTEALDKLNEFLQSDKKTFLLQGKGGTGKTTIIKKALENNKSNSLLIIAPTHKAKDVIEEQVKDITQNLKTLASALAIKLDENTGKFEPDVYARKMGNVPISKASLIVIDESSMVSDKLLEEIKTLMPSKAKIIFMGDKAQLPPVGQESDSKVFDISNGYELTEKMRQAKTSPIINIGTKVAANVESDNRVANPITLGDRVNKYDEVSKSSITWENSENEALNQFVEDIQRANDNVNYAKVITFNNQSHNSPQSVKNLNKKIRNKLFGERASSEEYIVGEIVTAYDSFIADTGRDKDETLFNNSEDLIVTTSSFQPKQKFTITVSSQKDGTRKIDVEFDVNYLELKNRKGKDIDYLVPVIAESSKNDYEQTLQKLFRTDRQLGYALSKKFANIQHGYAITSHKAQGSTYTNVYVMEDNIMGASNGGSAKSKNQSLYVAVSRPTTKLVMVSSKNGQETVSENEEFFERDTWSIKDTDSVSPDDYQSIGDLFDEILPSNLENRKDYSSFVEKMREYNQNCK